MAESRALDDLEELIPEIVFWGGLGYITYWTLQRLEDFGNYSARTLRPQTFGFGEGGLIDRWTLNPGEAARMLGRARQARIDRANRFIRNVTSPFRAVSRWF